MFAQLAARLGIDPVDDVEVVLRRLDNLTPGDFAALGRKCRLVAPADALELAERLRRVCGDKRDTRVRSIGFAA